MLSITDFRKAQEKMPFEELVRLNPECDCVFQQKYDHWKRVWEKDEGQLHSVFHSLDPPVHLKTKKVIEKNCVVKVNQKMTFSDIELNVGSVGTVEEIDA